LSSLYNDLASAGADILTTTMPVPRGKKRKSDQSVATTEDGHLQTMSAKSPTKMGEDSQESPRKRRKLGVTLAQKQALMDNLQLEGAWPGRVSKHRENTWLTIS
jgi:hypothetical protein